MLRTSCLPIPRVWRLGWWSEGDLAIQVVAIIEWRKSASGSLASMMFQSSVAADSVPGTYLYNGMKPRAKSSLILQGATTPAVIELTDRLN